MGNWSELPKELLEETAENLTSIEDYIRFRAVCESWRSMVMPAPTHPPIQSPWLMLPYAEDSKDTNFGRFFSLLDGKIHRLEIPEFHEKLCWGSSHGWLCMVEESPKITLLNPVTRQQIQLPPITTFAEVLEYGTGTSEECCIRCTDGSTYTLSSRDLSKFFASKVVLSSSPITKSNDCVALAIHQDTNGLAFCRPGNKSWTVIHQHRSQTYDDAIYYKGQFCVVDSNCAVVIVDVGLFPKLTQFVSPHSFNGSCRRYLVESSGELLLVCRFIGEEEDKEEEEGQYNYGTKAYSVFKLDQGNMKWVKVKSLGDRVLFIGNNSSISLSSGDFPESKPNCIYFADDYRDWFMEGHDMGIYNLEDSKIDSLPCFPNNPPCFWLPATWITPSLC